MSEIKQVDKTNISEDNWKKEIEERKKKAKIFLGVNFAILLIAVVVFVLIFFFIFKSRESVNEVIQGDYIATAVDEVLDDTDFVERKIDGVMVPEGHDNNYLMALMIDNHSDARPPSGLAKANLVFEAEVEGGITRIMGVFSTGEDLAKIGPIRSARPYFVDWARELSALYAHVGGSPDALVKIQQDKIQDINEFFAGKYFWRDDTRPMPHNVYTSSELLEKYLSDKSSDKNRIVPWYFKDDIDSSDRPNSSSVSIGYRLAMYKVEWKYDRESNRYVRFVAGKLHTEKGGDLIEAKNVIIQMADAKELDDKLRLEMNNIGTGKSVVCLDGKCKNGSWEKKHPSDRTRFYYEDGKEVYFNRGMSWIQVIRPEIEYTVTSK